MSAWGAALAWAAVAASAVYAYAVAALWTHHRLARIRPPRTLVGAVLLGLAIPACGCTALPLARRAPPRLRAPFLVAAYAGNPLLALAALVLAGWAAAVAVVALAALAAVAARALPEGVRPGVRLDDLLLPRDARPLRDAAPYALRFGAPALAVGGLAGAGVAPAWAAGLALGALSLLFGPPRAEVALDHGGRLAGWTSGLHAGFSLAAAAAAGGLAAW